MVSIIFSTLLIFSQLDYLRLALVDNFIPKLLSVVKDCAVLTLSSIRDRAYNGDRGIDQFMTTISEQINRPPAEQRMILHNVGWETYEKLLADLASQSSVRLTYDRGILEIMSPLSEHEIIKHVIERIVEITAEELGMEVRCFGSTTFRRAD